MSFAALRKHQGSRGRLIGFVPFARHTRYMVRTYLRHVFIILVSFSVIALSIDLPPQLAKMGAASRSAETGLIWPALRLVAFRTVDIVPRFIALACFLGVFWAEIVHTTSRERVVVSNSGRSPSQSLMPLVVLGLCMGLLQAVSDVALRPAAIAAQVSQGLGHFGDEFHDPESKAPVWLSKGSDLLHAVIHYGPPAVLRDVTLYRLNPSGHLLSIYKARSAAVGPDGWVLHDGTSWLNQKATRQAATGRADSSEVVYRDVTVDLAINPLTLTTFGIDAELLPQATLSALANVKDDPIGTYRTALQLRYAGALLPLGMALIAGSLSLLFMGSRVRPRVFLGILLLGYVAHLGIRTSKLLGEHDYINPVMAGWSVPLGLIGGSIVLLVVFDSPVPLKLLRAARAWWGWLARTSLRSTG